MNAILSNQPDRAIPRLYLVTTLSSLSKDALRYQTVHFLFITLELNADFFKYQFIIGYTVHFFVNEPSEFFHDNRGSSLIIEKQDKVYSRRESNSLFSLFR